VIYTGIRAEENHVTGPGTFTGILHLANINVGKHVKVTVTINVID
jgi:predicted thioesterase